MGDWTSIRNGLALVGGLVVVVAVGFMAIKVLPNALDQPDGLKPAEQLVDRGQIRTATLAYLVGIVTAAGAVFAGLSFRLTRRINANDRLFRAIELLASTERSVRSGALHVLGHLAREDPGRYHRTVIDVVSDYIRTRSSWRGSVPGREPPPADPDIQIAIDVLAARNSAYDEPGFEINLSQCNLRRVTAKGIVLCWANLTGTQLQDADLSGARLREAILVRANVGRTLLIGADLTAAALTDVNLDDAITTGTLGLPDEHP